MPADSPILPYRSANVRPSRFWRWSRNLFKPSPRSWALLLMTLAAGAWVRSDSPVWGKRLVASGNSAHEIMARSISPDGKRILTMTPGIVSAYDTGTGKLAFTLSTRSQSRIRAMFSPDGARILTFDNRGTVELWDAQTGGRIVAMPSSTQPIGQRLLSPFSPDGRTMALCDGKRISLFDTNSGALLPTSRPIEGNPFEPFAFPANDRTTVTAVAPGRAHVFDARTGEYLRKFTGGGCFIVADDGKSVAVGEQSTTVLNFADTKAIATLPVQIQDYGDARLLNGGQRLYGFDPTKPRFHLAYPLTGQIKSVDCASGNYWAQSPDGSRILLHGNPPPGESGRHARLRLFDADLHFLENIDLPIASPSQIAFHPDGQRIFAQDTSKQIWLISRRRPAGFVGLFTRIPIWLASLLGVAAIASLAKDFRRWRRLPPLFPA